MKLTRLQKLNTASFTTKTSSDGTVDASFGASIEIYSISFVDNNCSSVTVKLKTDSGFKNIARLTFTNSFQNKKRHQLLFRNPVKGSIVRFATTSNDKIMYPPGVTNIRVIRASQKPQKALLHETRDGLNRTGWAVIDKLMEL